MKSSTELLREMEKDARVTFYGWLVFPVWLVIARWQGFHSAADNLLQWRLWFLFGGFLLLRIVIAAISETTEHSIPGAPIDMPFAPDAHDPKEF